MSEIIYVLFSALWILGLSVILAAVGIGSYLAGEAHQSLGKEMNTRAYRLAINLGAVLFCAGLAGLAGTVWEKILWACLGISLIIITVWEKIEQSRVRNRTHND